MLTMYSKDACGQCKQADILMSMKGVDYEVKKLGVDYSRDDLLAIAPDTRSMPVIFDGDKLVGGLAELKLYLNT